MFSLRRKLHNTRQKSAEFYLALRLREKSFKFNRECILASDSLSHRVQGAEKYSNDYIPLLYIIQLCDCEV